MDRFGKLYGIYVLCIIIPILIIKRAFNAVSKNIRTCLIIHAIPSMIATVVNIIWVVLVLIGKLELRIDAVITSYAPLWCLLFAYCGYSLGKRKARRLQAELVTENQIDVMDIRGQYHTTRDLTKN